MMRRRRNRTCVFFGNDHSGDSVITDMMPHGGPNENGKGEREGWSMQIHHPYHKQLPTVLQEPYYYLSSEQARIIKKRLPSLEAYVPILPAWVPHRQIADALGYSDEGICRALEYTAKRPYVWATEFENVHTLWQFDEPAIVVDGAKYPCIETYYHAQKPTPFDSGIWDSKRVGVMQRGLAQKFQNTELAKLLNSTLSHPLVSVKPDSFWGIDPRCGGRNMLATLLEELRGVK